MPAFTAWDGDLPYIVVSQEPAELVMIDGTPRFDPVPGTGLLFMSNTDSSIFVDENLDGDFFILLSGRWFKTPSLGVPLQYASDQLPEAFSNSSFGVQHRQEIPYFEAFYPITDYLE